MAVCQRNTLLAQRASFNILHAALKKRCNIAAIPFGYDNVY